MSRKLITLLITFMLVMQTTGISYALRPMAAARGVKEQLRGVLSTQSSLNDATIETIDKEAQVIDYKELITKVHSKELNTSDIFVLECLPSPPQLKELVNILLRELSFTLLNNGQVIVVVGEEGSVGNSEVEKIRNSNLVFSVIGAHNHPGLTKVLYDLNLDELDVTEDICNSFLLFPSGSDIANALPRGSVVLSHKGIMIYRPHRYLPTTYMEKVIGFAVDDELGFLRRDVFYRMLCKYVERTLIKELLESPEIDIINRGVALFRDFGIYMEFISWDDLAEKDFSSVVDEAVGGFKHQEASGDINTILENIISFDVPLPSMRKYQEAVSRLESISSVPHFVTMADDGTMIVPPELAEQGQLKEKVAEMAAYVKGTGQYEGRRRQVKDWIEEVARPFAEKMKPSSAGRIPVESILLRGKLNISLLEKLISEKATALLRAEAGRDDVTIKVLFVGSSKYLCDDIGWVLEQAVGDRDMWAFSERELANVEHSTILTKAMMEVYKSIDMPEEMQEPLYFKFSDFLEDFNAMFTDGVDMPEYMYKCIKDNIESRQNLPVTQEATHADLVKIIKTYIQLLYYFGEKDTCREYRDRFLDLFVRHKADAHYNLSNIPLEELRVMALEIREDSAVGSLMEQLASQSPNKKLLVQMKKNAPWISNDLQQGLSVPPAEGFKENRNLQRAIQSSA